MSAEDIAHAWDEGCRAAEQYYRALINMPPHSLDKPVAPLNPYRPLDEKGQCNLSPALVDDYPVRLEARVAEQLAGMAKATRDARPAVQAALRRASEASRLK